MVPHQNSCYGKRFVDFFLFLLLFFFFSSCAQTSPDLLRRPWHIILQMCHRSLGCKIYPAWQLAVLCNLHQLTETTVRYSQRGTPAHPSLQPQSCVPCQPGGHSSMGTASPREPSLSVGALVQGWMDISFLLVPFASQTFSVVFHQCPNIRFLLRVCHCCWGHTSGQNLGGWEWPWKAQHGTDDGYSSSERTDAGWQQESCCPDPSFLLLNLWWCSQGS